MSMPRCIPVTAYQNGNMDDPIDVYLDSQEVEMISVAIKDMKQMYRVFMKSGNYFQTNEDDYLRIERAMRERS